MAKVDSRAAHNLLERLKPSADFEVGGVSECVGLSADRLHEAFTVLSEDASQVCASLTQISCFFEKNNLVLSWFFKNLAGNRTTLIRTHLKIPASGEWMEIASARSRWPGAEYRESEISELFGIAWVDELGQAHKTTGVRLSDERMAFPLRLAAGGAR